MKKFNNNCSGITLISLIITVIILMILAAATINVAIDGNSFRKAENSFYKTDDKISQTQSKTNELIEDFDGLNIDNNIADNSMYETYAWVRGTGATIDHIHCTLCGLEFDIGDEVLYSPTTKTTSETS